MDQLRAAALLKPSMLDKQAGQGSELLEPARRRVTCMVSCVRSASMTVSRLDDISDESSLIS
jgi:hypothetical protein